MMIIMILIPMVMVMVCRYGVLLGVSNLELGIEGEM